jgi:hypothetical protein
MDVNWFWMIVLIGTVGPSLAGPVKRRIQGAPRRRTWYLGMDLTAALVITVWIPIIVTAAFGLSSITYLVLLAVTAVVTLGWAAAVHLFA